MCQNLENCPPKIAVAYSILPDVILIGAAIRKQELVRNFLVNIGRINTSVKLLYRCALRVFLNELVECRRLPTLLHQSCFAMIDDSATVKRFYRENGRFRLQPENSTMAPIYADEVTVLGKVISLYRLVK